MTKQIRWGIVGCGNVTEVKSGPGFQKARHSALVAVMRRNGALAKDYARRHGVPRWYENAQDLIDDPQVDAVYVATPPASHREYAIMAARAGKPVYVEKPMALNYGQCQEMLAACRLVGVPLFVAYYRRALPWFVQVKELLEAGAIGQVRFVTVTLTMPPRPDELDPVTLPWRVIPELAGGGRFVDLASHQLDFLDYALGPIRSVQGLAANQAGLYRAEDIVTATWAFASGAYGIGTWCFTAHDEVDVTQIVGSRGRITYSTFGSDPLVLSNSQGVTQFPVQPPAHVQQPLIQAVVDDLRGVGRCPSTGETAARTTWVMDQILQSYYDPRA